ncbi:MAG: agmatine deiminase family protein [Muribaculaceae bacterium]
MEIIATVIGVLAGLFGIYEGCKSIYNFFRTKPLYQLMNELADKNTPTKKQRAILRKMQRVLLLSGKIISNDYINSFSPDCSGKINIFRDICIKNNIEPTRELCIQILGSDDAQFRREWSKKQETDKPAQQQIIEDKIEKFQSSAKIEEGSQVVYLSALLASQYTETCKHLTDILNKHNIPFAFLEGTKDIWCRDYMPVQTPSGKLIQFRYEPSYLNDPKYSDSRSDVKHIDKVNGISPIFSDINLDGGNVVMYGNKAIITDRIFSENPDWSEENLKAELANLLECEIIIIPAYKPEYDFTGHADGMMRFVDSNTVLVNNLDQDLVYMKKAIIKALDKANLNYVNFPWFEHKIKGNTDHAIGIYLNYLEVGNLIILPMFGVSGNKDAEALAKLKDVFPNKIIETIDYNDVALTGGVLNCTTWVLRK